MGDTNNPKSTKLPGSLENPQRLFGTAAEGADLGTSRVTRLMSAASRVVKAVYNAALSVFTRTPTAKAPAAVGAARVEAFTNMEPTLRFRDSTPYFKAYSSDSDISGPANNERFTNSGYHSE